MEWLRINVRFSRFQAIVIELVCTAIFVLATLLINNAVDEHAARALPTGAVLGVLTYFAYDVNSDLERKLVALADL